MHVRNMQCNAVNQNAKVEVMILTKLWYALGSKLQTSHAERRRPPHALFCFRPNVFFRINSWQTYWQTDNALKTFKLGSLWMKKVLPEIFLHLYYTCNYKASPSNSRLFWECLKRKKDTIVTRGSTFACLWKGENVLLYSYSWRFWFGFNRGLNEWSPVEIWPRTAKGLRCWRLWLEIQPHALSISLPIFRERWGEE